MHNPNSLDSSLISILTVIVACGMFFFGALAVGFGCSANDFCSLYSVQLIVAPVTLLLLILSFALFKKHAKAAQGFLNVVLGITIFQIILLIGIFTSADLLQSIDAIIWNIFNN